MAKAGSILENSKLPTIPHNAMPMSVYAGIGEQLWLDGDTEHRYAETNGHPVYTKDSIIYSLNSHGYRCPEFDQVADIKVISIGCSETFGIGLPQEALFHELFCEKLRQHTGRSVVNWNISEPGASCDYVQRMLLLAVPLLRPNLVLINYPTADRREYCSADGYRLTFLPGNLNRYQEHPGLNQCMNNLALLTSDYDSQLNVFRSYKSIEVLLRGTPNIVSFCNVQTYKDFLGKHLNESTAVGDMGPKIDHARDFRHTGPKTHSVLFEKYWKNFCESNLMLNFTNAPAIDSETRSNSSSY